MLMSSSSNCEKMLVMSSTPNEWRQNKQIDEKGLSMASDGNRRVMEKPSQEQQQQQQQPLKCPRCDSSNTKFCYYNNYSLSQPRHFCKACKRYWTRGGTLRNVPVGGGCRKNKRVKRPAPAVGGPVPSAAPTSAANHSVQPQIDLSSASNHINPLFYGLPTNPSDLSRPYSRFNSRVSNVDTVSGYDLQPQLHGLGSGFSSRLLSSDVNNDSFRNGFNPTKQIQDAVTSNSSLLSSYPIFGSSTSAANSPTMASLLAASSQHQKLMRGSGNFQGLAPYEELQMPLSREGSVLMKGVKMVESQMNRMDWNVQCQNQMEHMGSADPSISWNTTGVGPWLDPANIGSSVPSLI